MTKYITSKEFIKRHNLIISNALNDYLKWFDEGTENYKEIQDALNDFDLIGGEE